MRRALVLLLLVLAFPASAADFPARVVGITDGDTITVLAVNKQQHRIRLWGIDAPEAGQPFGARAKQAASEMAFGQTVTIRARDTDRYGRTVAEVILPDGASMSQEMVATGWPGGSGASRRPIRNSRGSKPRPGPPGVDSGASRTRFRPGSGDAARAAPR
jgi:endonuclease YncB( thermonuclease family)